MKKKKSLLFILICIFALLLGTTLYASYSINTEAEAVVVKSITPVYDKTSGIEVESNNVTFNDKNQVVEYKVVIENKENYDVKINDINLTTPTEEFLKYEVEGIQEDDIVKANSKRIIIVYLETMGIKGWGKNFNDELTANISFEKVAKQEEVNLPTESDKEETTKEETPKEDETPKEESPKEESPKENESKVDNPYTSDNKLLIVLISATAITGLSIIIVSKNKFTKYSILIIALSSTLTFVNAEETIELPIKLNVSFKSQNVMKPTHFEYNDWFYEIMSEVDYWGYARQIKNIYIQNEITEINEVKYSFDVTDKTNGRVMAYLVERNKNETCDYDYSSIDKTCYDLYLQADGIIYPNSNASYYFYGMTKLDQIYNINGMDTSEVTNMSYMFYKTGYDSLRFTLDLSGFDTNNVTNMSYMFQETGYNDASFMLDVSNLDTSNVTDMSYMFYKTGYNNPNFTLDVSNFDTSNVTDMEYMFSNTGYNSTIFTLDVTNFNTSKVTDMSSMFNMTGYNNPNFTLDVSNFDTSKVTDMSHMFNHTGHNSTIFTLDVTNFNTSNVTNMGTMFQCTGYNSKLFTLDVANFNTSNVTNMSWMFNMTGYNNPNFILDVSNFDTSKVTDMDRMFQNTGHNSTKLNISFTISNPKLKEYQDVLNYVASKEGTSFKLLYTKETEETAEKIYNNSSSVSKNIFRVLKVNVNNLSTGDEIHINGEKFNIVSQTNDSISMLTKYNIGSNTRQNTTTYNKKFADVNGWEYAPGPKNIDIQTWSTNPKIQVNGYVNFLRNLTKDNTITGDLMTLNELEILGCSIPNNYASSSAADSKTCANSPYKSWLANGYRWWLRSADSINSENVWRMYNSGTLDSISYKLSSCGVRPVITISKETIKNLN